MTEEKEKILSDDPRQAVEELVTIAEELVARMEIETNAVAINDGTAFSLNEMNKEHVADLYEKAANEFHDRLEEFRAVDKALLDKLQSSQTSLGQSTKNNLALLEKLQDEEEK